MADPWSKMRSTGGSPSPSRDPWEGLREPTPGALPQPQIRNPNPFNAMLSPDSPGILGMIGRLSGNPTRQESMLSGAGQASGAGIQAIQQRIANGMNPQSAIMDVLNSKEGMDWFTTPGADPIADITKLMQLQPQQQDLMSLSPGQGVFDPNTRESVFTQPTEQLQTFNGFAELSDLPETDLADLAAAQLAKDSGQDSTATERAAGRLLQRGVISQDVHDLMIAQTISVQPVMNSFNQPTGRYNLVDSSGVLPPRMVGPDGIQNSELTTPPETPAAIPQVVPTPMDDKEIKAAGPGSALRGLPDPNDPADIIRGGGLTAAITRGMGSIGGEISPQLASIKQTAYKNALKKIQLDGRELRSGTRLKADLDLIDNFINSIGSADTPLQVGQTLISWQDFLDSREATALATLSNANVTLEDRKAASADMQSINTARQNIPTRDQLYTKMEQLQQEPGPMIQGLGELGPTIMEAVKTILPQAGDAITKDIDAVTGAKPAAAPAEPDATAGPPAVGSVVDGYRFKGGDPNASTSWENVK